jgi:hypothetical protein
MLAYCGIDCSKCPAYRGTIEGDVSLLEEAARSFSNGAFETDDWVCLGCPPADQRFVAKFCGSCAVRNCAVSRGVQNCAACDDFDGCAVLRESIGDDEQLGLKMRFLRRRFVDSKTDSDAG